MLDTQFIGVLWDYDGTLVNSLERNYDRACACYRIVMGVDQLPEELKTSEQYIYSFHEVGNYVKFWAQLGVTEEQLTQIKGMWDNIEGVSAPVAYDGLPEVLHAFQYFARAINSQNGKQTIEVDLRTVQLWNHFDGYPVMGYQEALHPKPWPGAIIESVNQWDIYAPGVVYAVGDQEVDLLAARYAAPFLALDGVELRAIATAYGYPNHGVHTWNNKPDYVVNSPLGILDIIIQEFSDTYALNEEGILVRT